MADHPRDTRADGGVPPDGAARRRIRLRALAIALSATPFGVAYGAAAVAAGFTPIQACVLSLVLFSGASQFALVSVIGGGGTMVAALTTALLLGLRNSFYGTRIATLLRPRGLLRVIAAQLTIDESTVMAEAESASGAEGYAFWFTGLSVFCLWNLATVAGVLLGSGLGDTAVVGLDSAAPAAFVALLAPRLTTPRARTAALLAAVIALPLVTLLPPGLPVVLAGLVAIAITLMWR